MLVSLALTVYGTVLVAELVGDKTLYTVGSLTTTYRNWPVLLGAGVAVSIKMLAAVLFGRLVAALPPLVVSLVSATTFVVMAIGIFVAKPEEATVELAAREHWVRGARAAFLAIFLTEWADFGQITAAALVAEYGRPGLVWAFASLAMLSKVSLAVLFGMGFRRWVPRRALRLLTTATCLVMAVLAVFRVEV